MCSATLHERVRVKSCWQLLPCVARYQQTQAALVTRYPPLSTVWHRHSRGAALPRSKRGFKTAVYGARQSQLRRAQAACGQVSYCPHSCDERLPKMGHLQLPLPVICKTAPMLHRPATRIGQAPRECPIKGYPTGTPSDPIGFQLRASGAPLRAAEAASVGRRANRPQQPPSRSLPLNPLGVLYHRRRTAAQKRKSGGASIAQKNLDNRLLLNTCACAGSPKNNSSAQARKLTAGCVGLVRLHTYKCVDCMARSIPSGTFSGLHHCTQVLGMKSRLR